MNVTVSRREFAKRLATLVSTQNKNLSRPIPEFSPNATLGTMRKETGKVSERAVREAAKKLRP